MRITKSSQTPNAAPAGIQNRAINSEITNTSESTKRRLKTPNLFVRYIKRPIERHGKKMRKIPYLVYNQRILDLTSSAEATTTSLSCSRFTRAISTLGV